MSATSNFDLLRDDVVATISRAPYATMATADRHGRPRTRVLIAVWELGGDRPIGWLATFPTPVKRAHLAANPFASFSYWHHTQDTASLDTAATWSDDTDERHHVWQLYQQGSPAGVGYMPARFWPDGPDSESFAVLRLEPYRIQVLRGIDLAAGTPARLWRPDQGPPEVVRAGFRAVGRQARG